MEFIIELILDLIFEGSIEISKNKKISKWIRYPLIALISLFFIAVLVLIGMLGVTIILKSTQSLHIGVGIIIIILDVILIVSAIKKLKQNKENRN